MPFLRFSRDKRGYEHIYLMHAATRRGKPSRPRVLYWYRTPPGVKVGRPPFDDEVRRTLETANPGVIFDWPTIASTPMPAPDPAEAWRERRRLERIAKQARRQEPADDLEQTSASGDALADESPAPVPELSDLPAEPAESASHAAAAPPAEGEPPPDRGQPGSARGPGSRRRRRGGRRRRGPERADVAATIGEGGAPAGETAASPPLQPPANPPDPTPAGPPDDRESDDD